MTKRRNITLSGDDLLYVDVSVVPVGRKRMSVRGRTEDEIAAMVLPETPSGVCWYCCHPFRWAPVRLPIARDDRARAEGRPPTRTLVFSRGQFCTFECAKAFVMKECRATDMKSVVMNIALMANRARHLKVGERSCARNAVVLRNLEDKHRLRFFGGERSIEEFRKGCMRLDGGVCGARDDDILGLDSPRRRRPEVLPPAFIDASSVHVIRCEATDHALRKIDDGRSAFGKKTPSAVKGPGAGNPGPDMSIREKMAHSRRLREAPAERSGGARTLDTSMGVVVEKRRRT